MKTIWHKILILFLSFALGLLLSSCLALTKPASATSSGPRIIIIDNQSISAAEVKGFTSWICTDSMRDTEILLEVGFFNDSYLRKRGFILFDGGYEGESTYYSRKGLDHRWDWGPNGNEYAFVITPQGTGLYYDFTLEERAKASSVYKCYKKDSPANEK